MLCKNMVELFALLSNTQGSGARRLSMTQELLKLVNGIAHYLKILIRIALTSALKLGREHGLGTALQSFLDKLHLLSMQSGNPSARRMMARDDDLPITRGFGSTNSNTYGVTYGFRSLAPEIAGESPFLDASQDSALVNVNVPSAPSDTCVACTVPIEEDCVRLDTYQRWHSNCLRCKICGIDAAPDVAAKVEDKALVKSGRGAGDGNVTPVNKTARRPPANVDLFVYWLPARSSDAPTTFYCTDHASLGCRGGFLAVSRLEQYAFRLNVALRRLHLLLKKRNVIRPMPTSTWCVSPVNVCSTNIPSTTPAVTTSLSSGEANPYPSSQDMTRIERVRYCKMARLPRRTTIVESSSGKEAHSSDPTVPKGNPSKNLPPEPTPADIPLHREAVNAVKHHRALLSVSTLERPIPVDIPQFAEAAQATEPRSSTPPHNLAPYVAELTSLELTIVRYSAVAVLYRSPLRDEMDLDQVLETFEVKRQRFWEKLFKAGNARKKKGAWTHRFVRVRSVGLMMGSTAVRSLRGAVGTSGRARWRGLITRCIKYCT